jgi:hypothetical protein
MAKKITVGELKGVIKNLKSETADLTSKNEKLGKVIEGASRRGLNYDMEQKAAEAQVRAINHNESKIKRYQGIVDKATIAHDRARLAEKEAQYKRDYPLAPTYKK